MSWEEKEYLVSYFRREKHIMENAYGPDWKKYLKHPELPRRDGLFVCLFVCLFIEGAIVIRALELLDSKGLCSVWSPVVLQCGEPWSRLDTSSRLGAPLGWKMTLGRS